MLNRKIKILNSPLTTFINLYGDVTYNSCGQSTYGLSQK